MYKEWKEKWVKALRSGKYRQCTGRLERNKKYCCLGVLRNLINPDSRLEQKGEHVLHTRHLNYVGLHHDTQESLAQRNDDGWSFRKIADYIEQRLH